MRRMGWLVSLPHWPAHDLQYHVLVANLESLVLTRVLIHQDDVFRLMKVFVNLSRY